jgi:hypothetical protein
MGVPADGCHFLCETSDTDAYWPVCARPSRALAATYRDGSGAVAMSRHNPATAPAIVGDAREVLIRSVAVVGQVT